MASIACTQRGSGWGGVGWIACRLGFLALSPCGVLQLVRVGATDARGAVQSGPRRCDGHGVWQRPGLWVDRCACIFGVSPAWSCHD